MARNRMIKPDFFRDEKTGMLSAGAKVLFIGMWVHADDLGVARANPILLKSEIFPYDEKIGAKQIKGFVRELEESELVLRGGFNSEEFFLVKNFQRHQVINKPSTRTEIPNTNKDNVLDFFDSRRTTVVLSDGYRPKEKEKEKEKVKGKEKEKVLHAPHPELSGDSEIDQILTQVTEALQKKWLARYHGAEWIKLELSKASMWLEANPSRRPKIMGAFLTNWLNRADPPRGGQRNFLGKTTADQRLEKTLSMENPYEQQG